MVKKKLILILTNTTAFTGGVITTMAVAACSIQRLTKSNLEAQIENLRKINNDLGHQKKYEYDQYLDIAKKAHESFIQNSDSLNEEQKRIYKENALKNIKNLNEQFVNIDIKELDELKAKVNEIKIGTSVENSKPSTEAFSVNIGKLPDIIPGLLSYTSNGRANFLSPADERKVTNSFYFSLSLDLKDPQIFNYILHQYISNANSDSSNYIGLFNYNSKGNGKFEIKESLKLLLNKYEAERKAQNLSEKDYYAKPAIEQINKIKDEIWKGLPQGSIQLENKKYYEFLLSDSNEHKVLFTPHAKIFLKRLTSSLKNYNYPKPINRMCLEIVERYLILTVLVNGIRVSNSSWLDAYSLYLSNANDTDLVERFKNVYQQLKNNFWNIKPFAIDTESDEKTWSAGEYEKNSEFLLDGKNGLASKYPKRRDVQNYNAGYIDSKISTVGLEPTSNSHINQYSYAKNSGLQYVRLQLGTAELAKMKGKPILEQVDYWKSPPNIYTYEVDTARTEEEHEEVFRHTFLNPTLLPHIQVGYVDADSNSEVYFDGIIKEGMANGQNIPQNSTPLYLEEVIAKYLNTKWDKYQELMPPYVPFDSGLRRLSSGRYERFRLALATLELEFDQSKYTLADLLGSSVKPDTDKVGLYNEIFLEHVGEYLEQEQWGVYSLPENNFKLKELYDGKVDYNRAYSYNFDYVEGDLTIAMSNMINLFEHKFYNNFIKENCKTHPEWFEFIGTGSKSSGDNLPTIKGWRKLRIKWFNEGDRLYQQQLIEHYLTPPFAQNNEQLNLLKSKIDAYLKSKKEEFKATTGKEYNLDSWVRVQLVDLYTNPNNKELIYSHINEGDNFEENIIAQIFNVSFKKQIEYWKTVKNQ
ncbi:hypothetical protein NXS15_01630 [Mycoplasma sp. CSL7475-4]|uniref:hypothetical protein n=1 Tax=Mycoplasma sp. CSL7475-4 TaxID=2973942 RepID=UPI00216AF30B|nr:hypothetical protein [Mycoplasma sp. CSL7475-4]MCS4536823.1 hypothetical protein [Mycoplasma sp. CSL7475-4]